MIMYACMSLCAVSALIHFSICLPASLDKVNVEVEGQTYPLKKIAQLGMPNPQTIMINMAAYPDVCGRPENRCSLMLPTLFKLVGVGPVCVPIELLSTYFNLPQPSVVLVQCVSP